MLILTYFNLDNIKFVEIVHLLLLLCMKIYYYFAYSSVLPIFFSIF